MKEFFNAHRKAFRTVAALSVALLLLFCVVIFAACGNSSETNKPYASVSDDFHTDYYVGEALRVQGNLKMYVDATTFTEIPITEEMISGFDTSSAGTVIVKVTYGEFVASVAVTVHPMKATSITLDAETVPKTLYKDKAFPSTVTFSAVYSDGTTADGIAVTPSMLGGFDPTYVGAQNVSVTYLGASTSFVVTVKKDVRVSIELIDAKKEYAVGEALSVMGAQIKVKYESNNINYATLLPNNVSGFSTALGGDHVAKVSYSGLECDYNYFVRKVADTFALTEGTLPVIYEKGDRLPETGKGTLTYDDDTTEVISLKSENLPAFSTVTAGEKQIDIVVSGVTTTYSYTVLPGIYSVTINGFTENVRQNSEFDGLGELVVVYEDEGFISESLPFISSDATRSVVSDENGEKQVITTDRLRVEYRTAEAGEIVQKVYFRTCVSDFTVHVYDETERATAVNGITIAGTFSPICLGDPIDVTGVQVGIDYKYLDYAVADCMPAWVSVVLPESIEGDYVDVPLIVSYLGAEAEGSVRVLSAEYAAKVTSLNVYGIPVLYSIGDELSLANASAYVEYGGGYDSATVEAQDLEVYGFDSSSAGEKTLTITYDGGISYLAYRVLGEADKTLVTDITIPAFNPLLFVGDTVEDIPLTYELTLTLGYGYDSEKLSLADDDVALSGGPFAEKGRQAILLSCRGFEKTLYVTVHPASDKTLVTAIAVTDDVTTVVGTQPDLSQVRLVVEYGYGYRRETLPLETVGVAVDRTPFNGAQVGLIRTTVTYEGCTCGLFVNFVSGDSGNILQRLEISADSKDAFTVGEELSGLELILYYKNGTERLAVTAAMVPDFETETEGVHTVTISYGGKGVLYTYTVVAASEQQ